ncbi:precorrin-6A reductase [Stanieria cyanosphaera PCC 7437]|uniref:Precorrin-6A reductase n=1 Tax=Stanieria cyanosphaera (strain ATCC 29371 / PCC 7437) TaxID=111780 RepID=K9XPU6_STAC7|nr:cobalt-precorrin-6A reductase [Stanieria cyanosphaera]AFZ33697.1 precorrin-6A reductase [Stanieria cyanosphaera PCC 7437]
MRVLILGGTGDAFELAVKASTIEGIEVILSLAGRTSQPAKINVQTRIGGFGGIEGLVNYLKNNAIALLIDATHPYAAQISFNAATAAQICNIPYLILVRPPWQPTKQDDWIEVENLQAAADLLPTLAKRVFLTIGKQELSTFAHLQEIWFLMRMIDPPTSDRLIPKGEILLDKGTFAVAEEIKLLKKYQIQAIVSKNSGGEATYAKIIAARELGLPVVMVKRPIIPESDRFSNVESVLKWLNHF